MTAMPTANITPSQITIVFIEIGGGEGVTPDSFSTSPSTRMADAAPTERRPKADLALDPATTPEAGLPNSSEWCMREGFGIAGPIDSGARSCRRGLPLRHGGEHGTQVRHEPDEPDEDAEPVEPGDPALVLSKDDDRAPDRVHEHQEDGDHAGRAVQVERQAPGEIEHHAGADGVTHEPEPEEDEVPRLQPPLDPLAPHADGVEHEGHGDDDRRDRGHGDLSGRRGGSDSRAHCTHPAVPYRVLRAFSSTLKATMRRMRSTGNGLSIGNCAEPFPLLYGSSSSLNASTPLGVG